VDLVVQAAQPAAQLLAHLGVEGAEGLVEQQHARLDGQGAGEGHALALAARDLVREAPGEALELHEAQQLAHALRDGLALRARGPRPHAQAEGHVLEHGHVAEEGVVLEDEAHAAVREALAGDVLAVEQDGPAARVGLLEAGDDAQQRGLARARGPQQRDQAAGGHREAHLLQRAVAAEAEALADVAHLDAHAGAFPERAAARSAWATFHSTRFLSSSVSSASSASSEATAKAAENWYSL
jgi:hypothetical protein